MGPAAVSLPFCGPVPPSGGPDERARTETSENPHRCNKITKFDDYRSKSKSKKKHRYLLPSDVDVQCAAERR